MKFVRKFEEFRYNAPSIAPNRPAPETIPVEPTRPVKPQQPVEPAKPEEEGDEEYTIERPVVDPDPMAKKKEDEQLNKVVKRFLDESNKKKK